MFESRRVLLRTIERMEQHHADERRLLIEALCRATGKPVPRDELAEWRQRTGDSRTEREAHEAALSDLVDLT